MVKLSDYVMKFVAEQGVKDVFLLSGGGSMHLVDSLGRHPALSYFCCLHEQAVAIAAEAYAQYKNKLSVALVTTGPGGTNTVTGVAGAWLESTPCLFISGQVKRADLVAGRGVRQTGFQEVDIVSLMRPITKYAVTVTEPESIRMHLEKAVFLSMNGRRGPVWIDIPLDVQATQIDETKLQGYDIPEKTTSVSSEQVQETIDLFNSAERPVVLVGNGVRAGHVQKEFMDLMALLEIPTLTTWKTVDFMAEDHPLFMGRPGIIGQRSGNLVQQNADFLLILGARLDAGQTAFRHDTFARGAKKIVVDIDPMEIKKMKTPLAQEIPADVGDFIRTFLSLKDKVKQKNRQAWLDRCQAWKKAFPVLLPEYWNRKGAVDHYVLMEVLSDQLGPEDILVPGSSGACSEIFMQSFRVKEGQRVVNTSGLGAMGFGLPASIGACLAGGRRRTVNINGDGGFQMNIQELETVRRLGLPIKFFYLNNGGYVSIMNTQKSFFESRFVASEASSGVTLPDIQKVAAAYGLKTARIADHEGIRDKVQEVLMAEGPVVCEVITSPDQVVSPRVRSAMRADGTMVTKPMEDMWPYLDREEFQKNMLVPILPE